MKNRAHISTAMFSYLLRLLVNKSLPSHINSVTFIQPFIYIHVYHYIQMCTKFREHAFISCFRNKVMRKTFFFILFHGLGLIWINMLPIFLRSKITWNLHRMLLGKREIDGSVISLAKMAQFYVNVHIQRFTSVSSSLIVEFVYWLSKGVKKENLLSISSKGTCKYVDNIWYKCCIQLYILFNAIVANQGQQVWSSPI